MITSTLSLNEEQKKAVTFGNGPLLIIAGAGTGKTTVITERIKHLIEKGLAKPQEILALTFTEKASREMEERVDLALPYGITQMWISTFHAFCDRILRSEALAIGLDPNYKLMTEAETIQFMRSHLFDFDLNYFRPLGNATKFISGMIQHFSRLKDEDITPIQYIEWSKKQKIEKEEREKYLELAYAYRTYEELKVKESVADYGDLIGHTVKLFRTRKSILKRYQEQFKYILIDEFQDTNFIQNELAVLLSGKRANISVVGDDDQAIYRWRGAAVSNIIQFRKRFPKASIVTLTKNYRSTKEILDRSYELIQNNNPDRLEIVEKIDKKLECIRRVKGTDIYFSYHEQGEDEAEYVAKTIEIVEKEDEDRMHRDFAILVRANAHADPLVRALRRRGIPYQFLGPGQLYKQPEVKDLISYLKVLYDIHDSIALYRVLSMDYFAIPPRDIASLLSYARQHGISLFEACEELEKIKVSNDGKKKIPFLITFITKQLGSMKKETAGQLLYDFLEHTGFLKNVTSYATVKDERVAENIAKFFNKLKTYESDHEDASVFAVVDWLNLSMDVGESPTSATSDWSERNAVNILTIHSAKGLEFPVVFLVNLVNQRFPTINRKEQIPIPDDLVKEILPVGDYHTEEERRLFYVGMTRARDRLYFTASKYYGDGKREKKVSQFVSEAISEERVQLEMKSEKKQDRQMSLLEWKYIGEKEEDSIKRTVTYLSYSQLETYKTCPLQYRYRYVLRIPVPAQPALVFGDTIHRTIHAFYELVRRHEKVSKEILLSLLYTMWSKTGYRNKAYEEKMRAHGEELLSKYFDTSFDKNVHILALEQPFKLKVGKTLTIGGKIDRVDRLKNGMIEIIDYKTGSAPKNKKIEEDFQLTIYALAATDKGLYGKSPEDVRVSFYFFEGQEKISGTRKKKQLEEAKEEILTAADHIERSNFLPTPGKHCDFCEFRLICEAWK